MNITQSQTDWSMWEAIGTISASVLALFGWIWAEYFKPRLDLPKLVLECGEGRPFLASKSTPPVGEAPCGQWLCGGETMRLRLRNSKKHRGTAYEVQVRAMSIYDAQGVLLEGFDPTTLTWSATQATEPYEVLSPSDYEYLDLLWLPSDTSPGLEIKNSQTRLTPGRYYIKLAVYAENARPHTRNILVSFDHARDQQRPDAGDKRPYYSVKFAESIPEPPGHQGGGPTGEG